MIDLGATFFLQLINFIILYLVLRHFLFDPITNFMQERSEGISKKIEDANQKREEAEALKQEYKEKLQSARQEAQEIVEDSRRRAQRNKEDIITEAKEEANRQIEKAEEEIVRAKQQAIESLRDEVSTISVQIAQQILEQSIDQEVQEQTISNYIDQLDEKKLGEMKC